MVEVGDDETDLIAVEVAYAKPEEQVIVTVNVPKGTTLGQAVELSGLIQRFPGISQSTLKLGVFGAVCPLEQGVKAGDRVEVYRPLICDPKEARRKRASKP